MGDFLVGAGAIAAVIVFIVGIGITVNNSEKNKIKSEGLIVGIILSVIAAIAVFFIAQLAIFWGIVILLIIAAIFLK